jgi:protein gp37
MQMNKTGIEYCDYTWNPIIGCSHCSPGCDNCWAEKMACRIYGLSKSDINKRAYASVLKFNGDKPIGWNGNVHLILERLQEPLKVKKPSRIFVCDMGDLFHPKVEHEQRLKIFDAMADADQHTYLLLTKRISEAYKFFQLVEDWDAEEWPNVWLGVTVCNQQEAEDKIPILLQIPAAKRFVSVEPMLKKIYLETDWFGFLTGWEISAARDRYGEPYQLPTEKLDWVICGCESGDNRRPTKIEWVESLRDQCVLAKVPLFLKQLETNEKVIKMPKLDGKIWDQVPEEKE